MRKFRLLSAFFILLSAISFTSCDSEPVDSSLVNGGNTENPGATPGTTPGVFKADFNNQTFTATLTNAVKTEAFIAVQGIKGTNGEMFSLVVDETTTGTFTNALLTYNPSNVSEYAYTNINPDLSENEENGSVIITTIDTVNKTISGTFSFTGYWSDADANIPPIVFTNGSFTNIPYTDSAPGDNTEYLKASVNGQALNYSNNIIAAVTGDPNSIISVNGFTSDNNKLNLFIKESLPVGTHAITGDLMGNVRAEIINNEGEFAATTGTLIITSKQNGYITGTFQFIAGSYQVTNGSFNIEYDF